MATAKRKVFYSFHYKPDNWRAAQVRSMGVIDGNAPCSDNDWESITKGGDAKIQKWIADQLYGKSCAVVLVGAETAGRKWITYEIKEAWNAGKGVVGVRIHGLKDNEQNKSTPGGNPFDHVTLTENNRRVPLSSVVKLHDPTDFWGGSTQTYKNIKDQLADWIEEAVEIRGRHQ